MMDALQFLVWPFAACLILTGIHAYLGLHVVKRGVIFVDLSLAQIAALGTTVAVLMGHELHTSPAYYYSLGFTLVGAAIFAVFKSKRSQIPQEAFIGIVYVVSAALAILLMDNLPEGGEHLKHVLVGNLIAVDQTTVLKMAGLYLIVAVIHWRFRRPFLLISENAPGVETQYRVRWWDFLFYATFGFVVTSSVDIAGVLLVFSFLIVPPVTAMLFASTTRGRLAFGWVMGTVVSITGIYLSYALDAPTGAAIIVTFGAALVACAGFRLLVVQNSTR